MSREIKTLVVDDEELIRWSLQSALKGIGFFVDTASDGNEALDMLRKTDYDIVITDFKMPGLNGLELLEKIKEEGKKSKVIIISAYLSYSAVKGAKECGAFHCVNKPFGMDEFLGIVRDAVDSIRVI